MTKTYQAAEYPLLIPFGNRLNITIQNSFLTLPPTPSRFSSPNHYYPFPLLIIKTMEHGQVGKLKFSSQTFHKDSYSWITDVYHVE